MPKIAYIDKRFHKATQQVINQANEIIGRYQAEGLNLTLRQLYYRFVAADLIPNTSKSYDRLGQIISDARLAGQIDWNAIIDRTRNLDKLSAWTDPSQIVDDAATWWHRDLWTNQRYRPEIWIEKDALVGVIQGVCHELDVPYFSCRGYTSQSEMWAAAMRLRRYARGGQTPVILHFGDHDPSGIDMTRDIDTRLAMFMGGVQVQRIAMTMDQIQEYDPPPNPAKVTDSRFEAYAREYGDDSWELDALEPTIIIDLIRDTIAGITDQDQLDADIAYQEQQRQAIQQTADAWRNSLYAGQSPIDWMYSRLTEGE